jgi:hypothetical protein
MKPTDDDLDRTLRGADPAASLRPLSPARFERLMKDTTMTPTTTTRAPRTRILVIAGGVAATAIAAFAITTSLPASAPTHLNGGISGIAVKCAAPTVESYADVDLAFEATVASIDGDTVTLHVTDRFTGTVTDTVVTTQGDGAISDGGPLVYQAGETYLIAAIDGTVLSCAQSGVESPELRELYDAAF